MSVSQDESLTFYKDGGVICHRTYGGNECQAINGPVWVSNTVEHIENTVNVKELPDHPFIVGNFILVGLLLAMSFVSWAKGDATKRNVKWHNEMSSLFLTFAVVAAVPLIVNGILCFLGVVFG